MKEYTVIIVVAIVVVLILTCVVWFVCSGNNITFHKPLNTVIKNSSQMLGKHTLSPDLWIYLPDSKKIPETTPYGPYFPLEKKNIDKIVAFDDVLTDTEAMYLVDVMSDYCETLNNKTKSTPVSIILNKTPWVRSIEKRIAKLLQVDPGKLEPLIICRQCHGDETNPHMDTLDDGGGVSGQRLSTMVVFLNNLPPLEDGGRIIFNRLDAGLYPKTGTGIAWNNIDVTTFEPDHDMWHTSQAVYMEKSVKYTLVAYSREREYVNT